MKDTAGGSVDRVDGADAVAAERDDRRVDVSPSTAALVAGGGLLAMAALSALSIPFLEGAVVPGDPGATAGTLLDKAFRVRVAIAALLGVVALDVVVAWALYVLFRPVSEALSLLAALVRVSYAAILAAAVGNLVDMLELVTTGAAGFGSAETNALALAAYGSFTNTWDVGLAVFGVHLLVVGYLAYAAGYVPDVIGVLVAIAGLGYAVDSIGGLVLAGYGIELAMVTFLGEVVFLGWLLYRGRTLRAADLDAA